MPNLKNPRLILVLIIVLFFSFWKSSLYNIMEWDEARNAINAYEMYHNGDFFNLYYDGQPDTWNAKPPLFIWLVAFCYKLFGFNELALRLPAITGIFVFFIFFYRLVRLKTNETIAFISCLILLGCNAIVERHMAISGDFDALLLCFLTVSTYYFIRFVDLGHQRAMYFAAFFLGLAFYTKGTAALLYIPGWILYVVISGKAKLLFTSRHTWLGVLLFVGIAMSWVTLVMVYGKPTEHSFYGSKNSIETMLVHDTFRRLTSSDFGQQPNYTFVFSTLDSKMSMWVYLFYAVAAGSLIVIFRKRGWLIVKEAKNELLILSWCTILPLAIILTLATNKHWWYFAPAFPYVAVVIAWGIVHICLRWRPACYVSGAFMLFTLAWHFNDLNTLPTGNHYLLGKDSAYWQKSEKVLLTHRPDQDIFLYLTWSGKELVYLNGPEKIFAYPGQMAVLDIEDVTPEILGHFTEVTYFNTHCIARIK